MSIQHLQPLVERLKAAHNVHEKLEILDERVSVSHSLLKTYLQGLKPECALVIKSILAIGQEKTVFKGLDELLEPFESLRLLVSSLLPVESFYEPIGGIVGYHVTFMTLVERKSEERKQQFSKAEGEDLSRLTRDVRAFVKESLDAVPKMAEIYPVGGAGDRLDLRDEVTKEPLPAAKLRFLGRSLLEGLIRDLQAKEFLYYKLYGKKVITPIVMMTSHEKRNHELICALCEEHNWFGRGKENFFLITQSSVPVISEEGDWVLKAPLELMTKPGGHGAIWKLAVDSGAFRWLEEKGITQALVRQINNPIAGVDYGLFAFTGVGLKREKKFGFSSCYRLLNTAEGMVVLVEEDQQYHIANIEYTDFALHGIEDVAEKPGSPYSAFPANTNILYVDLKTASEAAKKNPIPGMLINMKTKVKNGEGKELLAGRLESMMQSIADEIVDSDPDHLRSYLTYQAREKTISVTKKSYVPGGSKLETPVGAYEDYLQNVKELLKEHCHMRMPDSQFHVIYHPALGPLYAIIAQKIRGGELKEKGEMQLEIAELDMEGCTVEGSLLISGTGGRCSLQNVNVVNQGIDWESESCFWKNQVKRKEALEIVLHGNAEFLAEEITIEGAHRIEVPDGFCVVAKMVEGRLQFNTEKLADSSWEWNYSLNGEGEIVLSTSKDSKAYSN